MRASCVGCDARPLFSPADTAVAADIGFCERGDEVPCDSMYADDAAFCCVPSGGNDMVAEVARACSLVGAKLADRGMSVNWDRGKSGVLVELRGSLARAAKQRIHGY